LHCHRIRAALEQTAFSTDVILGFPGETDADFAAAGVAVPTRYIVISWTEPRPSG
jgi:tRNA A37 methylthiotransferase MiaB